MSQDQKFEQIWDFRRRDDDIDSSSDDSKSNLGGEPVLKNHKMVSNLVLPENDDIGDSRRSRNRGHLEIGKANKLCNGLKKRKGFLKRPSMKEGSKKKSKRISQVLVTDEFRIFTESILEDLRVARESMFARMKQEMEKLVTLKSASRPTRKKGSRAKKASQTQLKKSTADLAMKKTVSGDNVGRQKVTEERVNHDQAIEAVTSDEKEKGEMVRSSVKNATFSDHSNHVVSSLYLTLPSVPSDSRVGRNETSLSFERGNGNLMIDGTRGARHNCFLGIQAEEPFQRFSQMGSKNMGGYNQDGTESSCMGTGFPVPLHQRLDNSFNIPSQVVSESSSREGNIIGGLRMNGGAVRYLAGRHTSSDHLAPNNFHGLFPN